VTGTSPTYFRTLGIPIVRSQAFTEAEVQDGSPVAVVSQEMARRLWGGDDPVGRRFHLGPPGAPWLLRSSPFGVTAADPVTYGAIPLALLLVALLSS
jgi:hypothetical protein